MLHRAECANGGSGSGGGVFISANGASALCGRQRRLLSAARTVCQVLDVPALKREEASGSLRCFCTEAQAWRSWAERAAGWGSRGAALESPADDLLHYHSDADADGVTATQEIEFARPAEADIDTAEDAGDEDCSVCLDDDSVNEEASAAPAAATEDAEQRYNCFIWFLYTRAQSPYKAGLIFSPDTGSWTQFVTARDGSVSEAERLVATHSDAFSPSCPHLISGLRRLLVNLKYLVLRLQR